jgi:hypothetical protein
MRKLALALALLLSSTVHAKEFRSEKPIVCDSMDRVVKYFTSEPYFESPVWMGTDILDSTIQYTLLSNHKTGTWTIVMIQGDVGCVLGAGTLHTMIPNVIGDPT